MLAFLRSECGSAWTFLLWAVVGIISLSALGAAVALLVTFLRSNA